MGIIKSIIDDRINQYKIDNTWYYAYYNPNKNDNVKLINPRDYNQLLEDNNGNILDKDVNIMIPFQYSKTNYTPPFYWIPIGKVRYSTQQPEYGPFKHFTEEIYQ